MSYYSRLAYEVWEQENYYTDDDCSPPWEAVEEPDPAPSAQEGALPFVA